MTMKADDIIFRYSFEGLDKEPFRDYVMHALCRRGSCTFLYNGQKMTVYQGDLIIKECRLFSDFHPSQDFLAEIILINPQYIYASRDSSYAIKAQMELYLNPVIHLTPDQMLVCRANFRYVSFRLQHPKHTFYDEALALAVQTMLVDIFDIHNQRHRTGKAISQQYANLLRQFVELLDNGAYREHRDADWYAGKLFVSTKHLSFVTRQATGFSATYWINRYLLVDIRKQLFEHEKSVKELAEDYGFSSESYFCRYVEKNLGISPKNMQK